VRNSTKVEEALVSILLLLLWLQFIIIIIIIIITNVLSERLNYVLSLLATQSAFMNSQKSFKVL
jgi:hypothetical protein